jgi:DNA-binding LacI/PurR family transcriptional regulator
LEVVVPLLSHDFYVEVLRGVEGAIAATDYALVIRTVERAGDHRRIFADVGARDRADAVVIVSLGVPAGFLALLRERQRPAVCIDCVHELLPSVALDHVAAARAVVEHLVSLGHRRVAFVDRGDVPHDAEAISERLLAFRDAAAERSLKVERSLEFVVEYTRDAGRAAAETLLSRKKGRPTAIVAASDLQALGVLEAANARGLRVPEDLAIVGSNDIAEARFADLTTVRVPMREMGRRGVEIALSLIDGGEAPTKPVRLRGELVVRRSTIGAGSTA